MLPNQRLPSLSVRKPSTPVGKSGLVNVNSYSLTAPVRGSSRPIRCSPKLEYHTIPSASTMTSCGWITFRIDHPRRSSFRTGECLKLEVPPRSRAQIEPREVIPERLVDLDALVAALLHEPLALTQLRCQRRALVYVTLHAWQDNFYEIIGAMLRPHHAFKRMAAGTAK